MIDSALQPGAFMISSVQTEGMLDDWYAKTHWKLCHLFGDSHAVQSGLGSPELFQAPCIIC